MRRSRRISLVVASLLAVNSMAAHAKTKPITNREPDAMDIARTPITDLNLSRTEIPALLAEAEQRPYALNSLDSCDQLASALTELDSILGPDLDMPQAERARISEGRVLKSVVGSFVPFRSIIRELSGANRQERALRAAIEAGVARRGFLRGISAVRGCPNRAPSDPSAETSSDSNTQKTSVDARTIASAEKTSAVQSAPAAAAQSAAVARQYTSTPVVQQTR